MKLDWDSGSGAAVDGAGVISWGDVGGASVETPPIQPPITFGVITLMRETFTLPLSGA